MAFTLFVVNHSESATEMVGRLPRGDRTNFLHALINWLHGIMGGAKNAAIYAEIGSGAKASGTIAVDNDNLTVAVTTTVTETTKGDDDPATDEVQTITFSAVPTAGTWKLKFGAATTAALAFNAAAAAVQTAFRGLSTVADECTVTGNYTDGFVFTFLGAQAGSDVAAIEVVENDLRLINTLTIGGVALNAVRTVTSATTQFLKGASSAATATNIAAAINANTTLNKLLAATVSDNDITLTCLIPGLIGNQIAMAKTEAVADSFTLGAAALAGGTAGTVTTQHYGL